MSADSVVTVTPAVLRRWPLPKAGDDKEERGRTLIVGGSAQTPGAVLLAAEAAIRAGAGKLQIATVASVAAQLAVAVPEALVKALPEDADDIALAAAAEVAALADRTSCMVIGPGMLDAKRAAALVAELLGSLSAPVVLDAAALACVTGSPEALGVLGGRAVLTPNRKELALALGVDRAKVDDSPARYTAQLAREAQVVVSCGGPESWIAAPDGRLWVDQSGGAGLAVSGSGDVFAGVVGGLLARGASPEQAAVWANQLHGRAGDRLAAEVGGVGYLAREIPAQVPRVLAEIEV